MQIPMSRSLHITYKPRIQPAASMRISMRARPSGYPVTFTCMRPKTALAVLSTAELITSLDSKISELAQSSAVQFAHQSEMMRSLQQQMSGLQQGNQITQLISLFAFPIITLLGMGLMDMVKNKKEEEAVD